MPRLPITRARPYTPKRGQFAGQTFFSERAYRNALARAKGLSSYAAQQRRAKPIRSLADLLELRPAEREARERALAALATSRREGISLSAAGRREGTTLAAIRKWGGGGLEGGAGRRSSPTGFDRIYRPIRFWTPSAASPNGVREVELHTRDSRTASRIADWLNAVRYYARTGDLSEVHAFRRRTIRVEKVTYRFVTDRESIDYLLRAGAFDFESIYLEVA